MNTQYYLKILNLLTKSKYVSRKEIAIAIMMSPRKVQDVITQMNEYLATFGVSIDSKPGKGNGYFLGNNDLNIINTIINDLKNRSSIDVDKDYRKQYILMSLLSNEHITIQQIAEELYVSDRLVKYDLDEIKEDLKQYNLEIIKFSNKGISLKGEESDIRKYIANHFSTFSKIQNFGINADDFQELKTLILNLVKEYNYPIFDFSIENLVIHILTLINRTEFNHDNDNLANIEKSNIDAQNIAVRIVLYIENKYDIKLSESEQNYIYLQISLKREYKFPINTKVDDYTCEITLNMLQAIDREYGTKLQFDFNLCINLSLHFIMLIKRIKYDIQLGNPLIDDIKKNYLYDFELACCGANYINAVLNARISENEIGYIALYIHLSLNDKESKQKKNKILIVCTSGRGISEVIKRNFEYHFNSYIEELDVISYKELINKNEIDYDYIFSTIPIDKEIKKPIFYINNFLVDEDVRNVKLLLENSNVSEYFNKNLFVDNIKAKDKYEVINKMINFVSQYISLPRTFENNVKRREEAYSTSLGNNVAFPHPQQMIESQTFVCFGRLTKPIKWDEQHYVQLIIMVSIDKNETKDMDDLYDSVAKIINYPKNVESLIKEFTYNNMMNIICHK